MCGLKTAAVPRDGLKVQFRGRSLAAWSRDVLALAREGLRRRKRLDSSGNDETGFLGVLDAIAESYRADLFFRQVESYHTNLENSDD